MKVLIACEYSGIVRDAFLAAGHEAMSCDILPTESEGPHYQGDVRDVLHNGWDLMIAHPPCTYLSFAGLRHWHAPGRAEKRADALAFALELYHCDIPRVAMENPMGHISTMFRPADQYINPFDFGEPIRKRTGLWLKGLPPLIPTDRVPPPAPECIQYRKATGKVKLRHHTDHNRGGAHCQKARSRFFPGIAAAMASQWGDPERLARQWVQQSLFQLT